MAQLLPTRQFAVAMSSRTPAVETRTPPLIVASPVQGAGRADIKVASLPPAVAEKQLAKELATYACEAAMAEAGLSRPVKSPASPPPVVKEDGPPCVEVWQDAVAQEVAEDSGVFALEY